MAPLSAREPRGDVLKYAGYSMQVAPGVAATGNMGRPTNPLLVRDDVGKAKPSCYDLPGSHFPYGRPGNQDVEGAREVSMRWASHIPSIAPEAAAPDFVGFNKKAACNRITTAKDLKYFRREHDAVGVTAPKDGFLSARGRPGGGTFSPTGPSPSFAYGRKVRPSTPIHEVLSNRFGDRSERELDGFYTSFREAKIEATTMVRRIPLTTASRGHASTAKKAQLEKECDHRDLFKLSRFTKRAMPKVVNGRRRLKEGSRSFTPDLNEHEYLEEDEGEISATGAYDDESAPAW